MTWGERVVRWFGRRRDDDGDDLEPVTVPVSREKPHTPPPLDDVEERRRREEAAPAGGRQQRTPAELPVGAVRDFDPPALGTARPTSEEWEDARPLLDIRSLGALPAPAEPRAPVVEPFVPEVEPGPREDSGRDLPVRATAEFVHEPPVPEPADHPEPA